MLDVHHSKNVKFKNTTIKDSGLGGVMFVYSSNQVQFEKCTIIQSNKSSNDFWTCFHLDCYITLNDCTIRTPNALGDTKYIKQSGCKWY